MQFELYQSVALRRDLPQSNLKKGDVVTVVDFVPYPLEGCEECYILERFNAAGDRELVAVSGSDLAAV
ncbi:MAG: DUF4926 domain-containing protein [Oscillatoria princeps RMCB-10]|jgi:hypothetical protein|nr:DUF4926 domain-containing protein [Oscillatoria princeps RMCB-10]